MAIVVISVAAASACGAEPTPTLQPTPEPEIQPSAEVGDMAPGFTLPSTAQVDHSLESYRGDKNVVVVFYRAFW